MNVWICIMVLLALEPMTSIAQLDYRNSPWLRRRLPLPVPHRSRIPFLFPTDPISNLYPAAPASELCSDNVEWALECIDWASSRQCELNPEWMWVNCPVSCNRCGILPGAPLPVPVPLPVPLPQPVPEQPHHHVHVQQGTTTPAPESELTTTTTPAPTTTTTTPAPTTTTEAKKEAHHHHYALPVALPPPAPLPLPPFVRGQPFLPRAQYLPRRPILSRFPSIQHSHAEIQAGALSVLPLQPQPRAFSQSIYPQTNPLYYGRRFGYWKKQ